MDRSHSPEPKELRIILNVSFSKGISRIKQHATRDMLCAIQYDYSITVHNWKKTVKNDLMTWKDVIVDKQHSSIVSINKAEWVILLWCYSGYSECITIWALCSTTVNLWSNKLAALLLRLCLCTEESLIMQSLKKISSPEKKLKELVRKHAELVRMCFPSHMETLTALTFTVCLCLRRHLLPS